MRNILKSFKILFMNLFVSFTDFLDRFRTKLLPPQAVMLNFAIGNIVINRSIYVAAELGIADMLKDGPKSIMQLAEETGADADTLYRIMRTLTSAGIFRAKRNKYFETNKLGNQLRTDLEDSMCAFIRVAGADWVDDIWSDILQTTKTGKDYYENKYGISFFDWLRNNREAQEVFDVGMTSVSAFSDVPVIKAYDFSVFDTLVDVGGGHGSQLITILKSNPKLKGFLFDLPATIKNVKNDKSFKENGFHDRLKFVAGNFFESVPSGYDAYFMKSILHDWDDERAVEILTNCRKAMRDDSTLVVVEHILKDDENEPDFSKLLDINVLALMGGRVRTKVEYMQILEKSGLKLKRVIPTLSPFSILEARPI